MKTMKKLQVAVAAASLFVTAGSSMAASISQSGVTIAREAVSANTTSSQTLRAPTVTFNFDNGPAANANSTQDFNVTLQLGGDGLAKWAPASATYKAISALRRSNGNAIVPVLPASAVVPNAKVAIQLLSVDVLPGSAERTFRYKFRLVNNTGSSIGIGDLQLNFNGQNPGDGTGIYATGLTGAGEAFEAGQFTAANADYQSVKDINTVVNATTVAVGAGTTGNVEDGCGEGIRKVTVTARNFIGSGDGVEGESAGASASSITNNGYIQFATALGVTVAKGIAVDRNTDPLNNNALLVATGLGANNSMALGTVKFTNRSLDAWDLTQVGAYYKLAANDLDGTDANKAGIVDVASIQLNLEATNGFAVGTKFRLSNSPSCADTGGQVFSSAWVTGTLSNSNKNALAGFGLADVAAAFDAGNSITSVTDATVGNYGAPFSDPGVGARTDRAYICMQVPGGATLIPQSRFAGTATLVKSPEDAEEQANLSCKADLAGLGGGIKIDVRNYVEFAAGGDWTDYVRIINNSETVTADVTVQYILPNGKYGKWVSLGTLAPRESKFFSNHDIRTMMAATGTESTDVNAAPAGAQIPTVGSNARLRVSSEAASTLRVQNYLYNRVTSAMSEVSATQGADFVNLGSSARDHIDQDAQTGLRK